MRRRLIAIAVIPLLLCLLAAQRAEACNYQPDPQHPNDFRDLGQIFLDAQGTDYWCAINAHYALINKIDSLPDSFWKDVYAGEMVMLVMAAGLAEGGRGNMTPDLDHRLYCVTQKYFFKKDPNCGWVTSGGASNWGRGNTCMDDYAIAASGYAWMAAYLRKSGRDWYPMRWNAVDMIHQTFNTNDAVCIWHPGWDFGVRGPCNGCDQDPPPGRDGNGACHYGIQSLGTNGVQILSLNDGVQAPPYGIGLMSNVAAAFAGLEHAGAAASYWDFSDDERKIAQYIMVEGQQKSDSLGNDFLSSDCYKIDSENPPGAGIFEYGHPCWDWKKVAANGQKYQPKYYPVRLFYDRYNFSPPSNGYLFDQFDGTFNEPDFFHAGRLATYKYLGHDWFDQAPILSAGSGFRLAFRAPDNAHYMNAAGGPGSVAYATETSPTASDSQFILLDLNGGQLNDGDPVAIQVYGNQSYYLSAEFGGGGRVTADATSIGRYEMFTIHKLAGLYFGGPIANGDNIAIQSPSGLYLHIDNYGGSTITANAASAGVGETFNYAKVDDGCF